MGDRACKSHQHRPRHGPAAFMGAANRGVPHIEPVSRMAETEVQWRAETGAAKPPALT